VGGGRGGLLGPKARQARETFGEQKGVKLKFLIFIAFFGVGFFPFAISIGLNFPRVLVILEQAVEEQRLAYLQERFFALNAVTEKSREALRIFSLLPGVRDLVAGGAARGDLSPEQVRARFFALTKNWFLDRPEVLTVSVVDALGQEQFRMERAPGEKSFAQLPVERLGNVLAEPFFQRGMAVSPGELFVGDMRMLPPRSEQGPGGAIIRFGVPFMDSDGEWAGVVSLIFDFSFLTNVFADAELVSEDGAYHFSRQWRPGPQPFAAGQAFLDFPGLAEIFGAGKPRLLRKDDGTPHVWLPLVHEGGEGRQLWLVQSVDRSSMELWLWNFRWSIALIVFSLGLTVAGIAYFLARLAEEGKAQLLAALKMIVQEEGIPRPSWRWPVEIAQLGHELSVLAEAHLAGSKARKDAEEQLRQEKEHMRVTLRSIGDAVITTDMEGVVTSMNPVAAQLTGWGEAEAVGRALREVFVICNASTRDACENPVSLVLREGEISGLPENTLLLARDGREYHIADSAAPIRRDDGRIAGVVLVFRDVSEEYHREQELALELKIRKALANLSGEVIASSYDIAAIAGKILEKAQELTGSMHGYVGSVDPKSGSLVCHAFTPMLEASCQVHEDARRMEFAPGADGSYPGLWGSGLNEGEAFFCNKPAEHPASGGCPPGHIRVERFLSMPVRLGGQLVGQIALANPPRDYGEEDLGIVERLAGYFAQVVNVSRATAERDKLVAELRQAQKMEAVGTLAGGVAHDFNNMLTPILGYTELAMLQLPQGDKLRDNFAEVLKAAHRAKALVQQILTFSRQKGHELACVELSPALKECLKMLRASLPTTIEIRERICSDCGRVMADLTQMQQVLINLCTNAAHALEGNGGFIEVALEELTLVQADSVAHNNLRPGKYLRLLVSDNGCGMERAIQERIFEPYFTTKEQGKGTGLGLALVHGIVKSHNGVISVYSEPGQGSTFKIYFPVCCEAEGEEPATLLRPSLPKGKERLLLVDDEEQVLGMLREMTEFLGYKVTCFTDSRDAWEAFAREPGLFDLVITDQTMPGLTGDGLAAKILQLRPRCPIILCTGFSEVVSEEKARELGVREYLLKPVVVTDLAQALRRALNGKNGGAA